MSNSAYKLPSVSFIATAVACVRVQGDPGPLLVDIANKEQADILVLGGLPAGQKSSKHSSKAQQQKQHGRAALMTTAAALHGGDTEVLVLWQYVNSAWP